MNITKEIRNFFADQGFVIVSTIDRDGLIHTSCKGLIKMQEDGRVYLMDVFRGETHDNLKRDPSISITAVDEHRFSGYCLKGRARLIISESLDADMIKAWEDRVTSRLTKRLLKNIHEEKGHGLHPEILLPKPEYVIMMEVEKIVDLSPHALKIK